MGLTTLFDKSFIQSLSVDESVWFDKFFYSIICPIFYIETLADLSKKHRDGRNVDAEVSGIANKTPEMQSAPSMHHQRLAIASLFGYDVPMTGQIPVPRGRPVKSDGKNGVVFDESEEAEAFSRWQRGRFGDLEREFAHQWRESLTATDLAAIAHVLRSRGFDNRSCRTLEEALSQAKLQVSGGSSPFSGIKLAADFFGLSAREKHELRHRWEGLGCRPLSVYAPYAAHVLTVEIFFYIAMAAGHIGSERASNRTDIAYLYYLPFCLVFVSTDKLHRRCAPLFLRPDQSFVWGADLKADLQRLNSHYMQLDDSIKDQGVMRMVSAPPNDEAYLTRRLWNLHFGLSAPAERLETQPPEINQKIADHLARMKSAPTIKPNDLDFDPSDADSMIFQRQVRRQRGSWLLVPKGIDDSPGPDAPVEPPT